MNKILYRAVHNNKWVYGDAAHIPIWDDRVSILECYGDFEDVYVYEVDQNTIGQYVCNDNNGDAIFTGDIIRLSNGEEFVVDLHDPPLSVLQDSVILDNIYHIPGKYVDPYNEDNWEEE